MVYYLEGLPGQKTCRVSRLLSTPFSNKPQRNEFYCICLVSEIIQVNRVNATPRYQEDAGVLYIHFINNINVICITCKEGLCHVQWV